MPTIIQPPLSHVEARNRCLVQFAHSQNQAQTSHLSYLILKQDPRLLYYVVVRTILPKLNSTDSLKNNKDIEAIYLLVTEKSINYSRHILGCMSKVSSILRLASLPYSNLLTLVFKHFGVPLDNQISVIRSVSIITPTSIMNI